MKIAPGVRLGPYEIVAPIGAGGMGEVYSARDTRLDRSVAIKVLPAALAQNPQLRLRFEREAKAISALTHPHICTLHDVGSHEGVDFLVMEHLDGESLADRLGRGPLPLDQTIRYGIEIADALDKAHRRGIVHRDLKPGNIMITKNGGAKLLDFGLARTIETAPPDPASATEVAGTEHKPLTEEGTILGTMQYMAPEQLDSQPADARTDIFAFGAVLYEMLTGKRAFSGKTRSSLIAAIVATEPPPVATIQPLTPASLERIIRICLLKDPDERWQSAHDVKLELQGLAIVAAEPPPTAAKPKRALAGWVAAALVAATAIGWYTLDRKSHQPPRSVRFEIAPQPDSRFNSTDGPVVISPDGTQLLFRIETGVQRDTYWLRRLDSSALVPLPATESGYDAVWSPDGRQMAFFAFGKLKKMDLASAAVSTVAEGQDTRGASWGGDTILFAPSPTGPIMAVSSSGGAVRAVTKLDASRKETGHWRPVFLPDGKRFLFLARSVDADLGGVYVASLENAAVRRILDIETVPVYSEPGYLLYVNQNTLYAHPFDADEARLTGPASVVAQEVPYSNAYGSPGYAANGGVVAWNVRGSVGTTPVARMTWSGAETVLAFEGANLDLSKDGLHLAGLRPEPRRGNMDIWIHDLRRAVSSRLTYDSADESGPVWSPDGKRVAYAVSTAGGAYAVKIRPAGSGPEEVVLQHPFWLEIVDWSRDGRTLLAEAATISNRLDLVTIDLATKKLTPFVNSPFEESSGRFSPDGKWIAYQSDESGKQQVSVQPFPPDGSRVQVSTDGGQSARWHADGRKLSYVADRRSLTSVSVESNANGLQIGPPVANLTLPGLDYVLLPDGSGVLAARPPANVVTPTVVVTNWAGPR